MWTLPRHQWNYEFSVAENFPQDYKWPWIILNFGENRNLVILETCLLLTLRVCEAAHSRAGQEIKQWRNSRNPSTKWPSTDKAWAHISGAEVAGHCGRGLVELQGLRESPWFFQAPLDSDSWGRVCVLGVAVGSPPRKAEIRASSVLAVLGAMKPVVIYLTYLPFKRHFLPTVAKYYCQ